MARMRVWLNEWEWACCGDPFAVGDRITLHVRRGPGAWVHQMLGPDLGATVDAEEEHHEEPGPERLTGTVAHIHGVTLEHDVRRERRTNSEPPSPVGDGAFAVMGSTDPFFTVSEPIPGTAALHPAPRVPWPPRYDDPELPDASSIPGFSGFLVDLETE